MKGCSSLEATDLAAVGVDVMHQERTCVGAVSVNKDSTSKGHCVQTAAVVTRKEVPSFETSEEGLVGVSNNKMFFLWIVI